MLVPVQLFVSGLYLPPVLVTPDAPNPPQTIISPPFHTAVWLVRPLGALLVLVAIQVSAMGLYWPPVAK